MKVSIKNLIANFAGNFPFPIRMKLLAKSGVCDKTERVSHHVYFDNISQVKIAGKGLINHHVSFNVGFDKDVCIEIGEKVFVAPYVKFICLSHEIGDDSQRAAKTTYKSIHVGDGSWIGANCTILQGVNIGKGCIIAAGAVVNKDIPDNEMWGGVPARFIKKLSSDENLT